MPVLKHFVSRTFNIVPAGFKKRENNFCSIGAYVLNSFW